MQSHPWPANVVRCNHQREPQWEPSPLCEENTQGKKRLQSFLAQLKRLIE